MLDFIWADPHFGHAKAIEFENRPFGSLEEMEEHLIRNYNQVVGPNDTCYWLGDCFFCYPARAKEIMSRLNGRKILAGRGNHDRDPAKMRAIGFSEVYERVQMKIAGQTCWLSHFPYRYPWWKIVWRTLFGFPLKHHNKRPVDDGSVLIHGHVHSAWKIRGRQICVSVENIGYTPLSRQQLECLVQKVVK
jgi:calcineurin-like phosphoesterase family protein